MNATKTSLQRLPTWFCAASPLLLLVATVFLAVHIRLGLGHWPEPMIEDYDSPTFRFHSRVHEWVILWTAFGAIPAWIGFWLFKRFRLTELDHMKQFALFGAGCAALVLLCIVDPTGFCAWFFD